MIAGFLAFDVYGASLPTGWALPALPHPSSASVTPRVSPEASPAATGVGDQPPANIPTPSGLDTVPFKAIPAVTMDSVKSTLERQGFQCVVQGSPSSGESLNCHLPGASLYTEAGGTSSDGHQVEVVSCRVYYSYVDTPPSQQQLLQVYDAVIAATESGAEAAEARAWVRTHLADPDRVTTAVGATTLAIDPKQAHLAVQG
ncbi:MAG: hypothetical protein M3072_16170 [Candidatus Dormibacteraeota bacterium]|nr:hypothetical protein [Candidatus Dormibacteraeota bacterium]